MYHRIIPRHVHYSWMSARVGPEFIEAVSAVSPSRRLQPGRDAGPPDEWDGRWRIPPLPRSLNPCGLTGPLTPLSRCCHREDDFPAWSSRYCIRCDRSSWDWHPEVAAAQAYVKATLTRARGSRRIGLRLAGGLGARS